MKHFQQFSMDNSTHVATIGAGTLLGDVTTRLQNVGRVMAHGTCPDVGAGGHFTIGGLGPTSRQWGLALDHIEEAEVVLANGSIVRASTTQNQDVLFAIKGAASSFGIVTEFKVRTHPELGKAIQYSYTFDFGNTTSRAQLFKNWQMFISDPKLSRKFASVLVVAEKSIVVSGTYFGSQDEFNKLSLVQHLGSNPVNNTITALDGWAGTLGHDAEDLITSTAGGVPTWFYAKSLSFTPTSLIPSSGIDALFHYLDTANKGTPTWFIIFDLAGGAVNDPPMNATSYAHRDALFWLQSYAMNLVGPISETTINFLDGVDRVIGSSLPDNDLGAYPGYVDLYLQNPQKEYWGVNLAQLQEIKVRIDPGDVFHNPQSVQAKG